MELREAREVTFPSWLGRGKLEHRETEQEEGRNFGIDIFSIWNSPWEYLMVHLNMMAHQHHTVEPRSNMVT